jgi:hypothetical protein
MTAAHLRSYVTGLNNAFAAGERAALAVSRGEPEPTCLYKRFDMRKSYHDGFRKAWEALHEAELVA